MSNTSDTRSIYEIFRACRLCGAGGGYKMPIIQSIIAFDCTDVELREKIRECVQIEVKADDKMPPLICELCVDKLNDFYDFLELCRQTNKRTRLRLGLPPQTMPQGAPEDCILGVTETVFSNDEEKPTQQRSRPCPKSKKNVVQVKKETVKIETPKSGKGKENHTTIMNTTLAKELGTLKNTEQKCNSGSSYATRHRGSRAPVDSRSSSVSNRSSPVRARETRRMTIGEQSGSSYATRHRGSRAPVDSRSSSVSNRSSPARARETRRMTSGEQSETPTRPTRTTRGRRDSLTSDSSARDTRRSAHDDNMTLGKMKQQEQKKKQEQQKQATRTALKKGKEIVQVEISSDSDDEALSAPKRGRDKDTPKADVPQKRFKLAIKLLPKPKVLALAPNECPTCGYISSAAQGLASHMRRHPVAYTSPELACDPCGDWFPTAEEAAAHHKKHGKYKCRHCKRDYKQLTGYYEHFESKHCRPFEGVPDVQCQTCWAFFPTATLMKGHKCPGTGSRPGGSCKICTRLFATLKSLKRHEDYCASKIKDSKPAKNEISKSVKNEISKPVKNEISKPAKNEISKHVKNEISKPAKNKESKPGPKPAKSRVSINPKIRSRLRPAAVRVAKCDPLLRKRKSKSGRYDVANVPHDYGLDNNCIYPYKYSGARVKSEPLCFNGMVSINKEIQRELYREEDYVHWDSDLSSDSENEVEEFGEKRRKVPTLAALSLKTIFSKRCLGKVPRKLRKVKQDKLFDSLFNNTVDDDLSCNINSIIDNLSMEDGSSVNLLSVGVNYDSDSVLGKSILGGDDLDAVVKDINKNSNDFDVNASDTKNNDKNVLECKNNLNDGDDTDASMDDTNGNQKDELANAKSGISEGNVKNYTESDRTEDLSSQNGDTPDDTFNPVVSNTTNDCENNDRTGKEDKEINNETANVNENQGTQNDYEDKIKENQESINYFDNKVSNVEDQETYAKNAESCKNGDFLNGASDNIDNFGSEIDDNKLMDDLNAQIGESEMKDIESRPLDACSNFSIDNLIDKSMPHSFGLGSIGDEEFI